MTVAELKFLELVPNRMNDIVHELQRLNAYMERIANAEKKQTEGETN